jgi:aspartyl/asparaginyl beta-hydroxylase (cupin superfamily)
MLARDGYEIRRAWCPVTPELLKEIAAIKTDPIFNDNLEHHRDPNRTWIIYKHAPASIKSLIVEDEA